jgi:hypothetical protein
MIAPESCDENLNIKDLMNETLRSSGTEHESRGK